MCERGLVRDVGIGAAAGYVGTRVMEMVGGKLYELESEADRQRENEVSPGLPYEIAAKKMAAIVGWTLTEEHVRQLGMVFHLGLGISWGPVYLILRRAIGLSPVQAGLITGAVLWAVVDEGLTPAMGWSAPNSAYPAATHIRAFLNHGVYGLAVAATAEAICWLGAGCSAERN